MTRTVETSSPARLASNSARQESLPPLNEQKAFAPGHGMTLGSPARLPSWLMEYLLSDRRTLGERGARLPRTGSARQVQNREVARAAEVNAMARLDPLPPGDRTLVTRACVWLVRRVF